MISYTSAGESLSDSLSSQLAILCTTPIESAALDRDFGIDTSCLDKPPDIAQNLLAAELAVKIPRYIPELVLVSVGRDDFTLEGELYLKVVVDYA